MNQRPPRFREYCTAAKSWKGGGGIGKGEEGKVGQHHPSLLQKTRFPVQGWPRHLKTQLFWYFNTLVMHCGGGGRNSNNRCCGGAGTAGVEHIAGVEAGTV